MPAWLLAAALAAAPLASQAEDVAGTQVTPGGDIQLMMGDRITVRLPASGRPEPVSVERATQGDASPPKPGAGKFDDTPRGTVVITLERTGPNIQMKVQSGIDKAFDYRAQLIHQSEAGRWVAEPTSVCTVLPLLTSYEYWPDREQASRIILNGFKLRDTNGVVCPAPAQAK